MVMDNLVTVVQATGRIGVVGVYVPQSPDDSTRNQQTGVHSPQLVAETTDALPRNATHLARQI
jgi:hypothetical protein